MEFLKAILGDDLYGQVAAKLEGNDKVKLANIADGAYVNRDKHDALTNELTAAKTTIKERDAQIVELAKQGDPAALKAEIAALQEKNAAIAAKAAADLEASNIDRAAQAYVSNLKFTSKSARDAFIGTLKSSGLKLDEKGDLVGASDIEKRARETDPDAFAKEAAGGAGFDGKNPPLGGEANDPREVFRENMFPKI